MTSISQHAAEIKQQLGSLLNGRIEAGQALALTGHVKQIDGNHWQVDSQSEPGKSYPVSWESGRWTCTCKDHTGEGYHPTPVVEFGGGVQETCKHILAAALCYFSGEYPVKPAFDLVIATKKAPFVSGADGHILWWKLAGKEKETPLARMYLTAPEIQKALLRYKLVDTEALSTAIVRRYQLLETEEN